MPTPISVGKRFGELKSHVDDSVYDRLKEVIPESAIVSIESYDYGEKVFDGSFLLSDEVMARFSGQTQRPLAVLLKGCVEISDEVVSGRPKRVVAYRPIRIARPRELLGDFSALDALFNGAGPVRAGETWSGWAGVGSIYCQKKLESEEIKRALIALKVNAIPRNRRAAEADQVRHKVDDEPHTKTKIRDALKFIGGPPNDYKTHIAYLEDAQSLILNNLTFSLWVTGEAWVRCKQYRNSFHAFNYHRLVDYRLIAQPAIEIERGAFANAVGDKLGCVELHDVGVPEMLFDLINRPLRNEPVFTSLGRLDEAEQTLLMPVDRLRTLAKELKSSSGSECSIDDFLVPAILEISSASPEKYYYPADQQNYFLAQWLDKLDDKYRIGQANRTYELFSSAYGFEFLTKIIRLCISTGQISLALPRERKRGGRDPVKVRDSFRNLSEKLYRAAHKDGVDESNHQGLTCVLEDLDGQLFCSYRLKS